MLPASIASQAYTPSVVCTALIYEFERPQGGLPALHLPSNLDAQTHLEKSGLWDGLGLPPSIH